MVFVNYKVYSIILYFFLVLILSSKIFRCLSSFINSIIDLMVIVMYIPITEIFLISIKCVDGNVYGVKDSEVCGKNIQILNIILGILGAFLFLIWCIFMINFKFYPFQKLMSTIRITSNNDILVILMKLFAILQYY